MGSFSIWHWAIVLLVVILIFGTKKLKKDGMKDGGAKPEEQAAQAPAEQVSQSAAAPQAKTTIDVEAKPKS